MKPVVTIEMESGGIIKLELYPEMAPQTVANFVKLAQNGYYDGTKLMLEKNEDIYWHGEYVSLPYLHKEINGGDTTCKLIWGSGIEIIKKNFPLLYEK